MEENIIDERNYHLNVGKNLSRSETTDVWEVAY